MKKNLDSLTLFEPVSLVEMEQVKLLDRMDLKYILHWSQLEDILLSAAKNHKILTIDNLRYADYETHYFDTMDFKFYLDHHNKRYNRHKVRTRTYLNSDLHFFEIKFKSNQNRTIKKRIRLAGNSPLTTVSAAGEFLQKETGISFVDLKETVQINCKRITLVDKSFTERVTIDFDIAYKVNEISHSYPELVIIEIKQNKAGKSEFRNIMRNNHIHSTSLSKYCFGVASFMPGIKKNNFKTQILHVNKICYTTAI